MKFCPNCGTPCEGANFCTNCGTDLRPYKQAQQSNTVHSVGQANVNVVPDSLSAFEVERNVDGRTYIIVTIKDRSATRVTIPDCVTCIGPCAFEHSKIESIVIPGSVKSIERGAFLECTELKSVTICEGVTRIGVCAFANDESLCEVNLPQSLKVVEDSAFSCCTDLRKVILPYGITEIGEDAFYTGFGNPKVTVYAPAHFYNQCKITLGENAKVVSY